MNVQKLNGILRILDLIKHHFSSNTKLNNFFLCTCFVLKHKFERNGPKISFWGINCERRLLYGLFFLYIKPKFSDFMQFYKMQLELRILELSKHEFSSERKQKTYLHCTCFVLDPNISLKGMDQKIHFNWLRKSLYGLFFCKLENLQTSRNFT